VSHNNPPAGSASGLYVRRDPPSRPVLLDADDICCRLRNLAHRLAHDGDEYMAAHVMAGVSMIEHQKRELSTGIAALLSRTHDSRQVLQTVKQQPANAQRGRAKRARYIKRDRNGR
jgi:hypothetical protein